MIDSSALALVDYVLADAVLSSIRTRADLSRWSRANEHGRQMHEAVDVLETAIPTPDPAEVYAVTHQALASTVKVIARADDSSGIIGHACRRLLDLHPTVASAARVQPVGWMMRFQFDGEVDYFNLDPVAHAPALGEMGMATLDHDIAAIIRTHAMDRRVAADCRQCGRTTARSRT